jgi:hypothetical protein
MSSIMQAKSITTAPKLKKQLSRCPASALRPAPRQKKIDAVPVIAFHKALFFLKR